MLRQLETQQALQEEQNAKIAALIKRAAAQDERITAQGRRITAQGRRITAMEKDLAKLKSESPMARNMMNTVTGVVSDISIGGTASKPG